MISIRLQQCEELLNKAAAPDLHASAKQLAAAIFKRAAVAGLIVTERRAFAGTCTSKSAQHNKMPFDKKYTELKPTGLRRGFGSHHLWLKVLPSTHLMSENQVMLFSCCSCCPPGSVRLQEHLPEGLELSREGQTRGS